MPREVFLFLVVIVMAAVTYPLRLLPATVISRALFGRYMQRVLYLMPYTALTALVFPGIFYSVGDHVYIAGAGTLAAILCAVLKLSLSATVILCVLCVYVLLLFV